MMMRSSNDGGFQPGGDVPASSKAPFTMQSGETMPVLVCCPHAGRDYGQDLLSSMRAPMATALRLEDRYADVLARGAAQATGIALIVAQAPRAMIDLNRAPDDMDWSMIAGGVTQRTRHSAANRRARSGLGLVPRRLPGIGEIWRGPLTQAELDARIDGVHRPYHSAIAQALETLRDRWGAALLVDLHSMPPLERDRSGDKPAQFVIGDRFGASCHRTLSSAALDFFEARGSPVAHNRPYAGGYTLDRHSAPARGVHAIQIEVCRSVYLDAKLQGVSDRARTVVALLADLLRQLGQQTAELGSASVLPLAAE